MVPPSPTVLKLGGSVYDLPDLGPHLRRWLTALDTANVLLVPGGGRTADVIRFFDSNHHLGEETAHWLALRALTLNAHFLAQMLSGTVVASWAECPALWQSGKLPILDAHAFALADDRSPGALPHCWDVTSDALAARVAAVGGARRLLLLKSVTIPEDMTWIEAAERGFVDHYFARTLARDCEVRAVNFRDGLP